MALTDWELPRVEMDHLLADLRATCPHLIVISLHPEFMSPQTSRGDIQPYVSLGRGLQ